MKTIAGAIVQVEFFSPAISNAKSIEQAMCLASERAMDGDRIKTVVRFRDKDGTLAKKIDSLAKSRDLTSFKRESFIGRFRRDWRLIWNLPSPEKRQSSKVLETTKATIRDALTGKSGVAVEDRDFRFRPVRGDEVYELTERFTRSSAAWYFVFPPCDDLCTETLGTHIAACL
jgi:hypothetical protein